MTHTIALTGYCPMGCGQTLVAALNGVIVCTNGVNCPCPVASTLILRDAETEHIVTLERSDFKIKHPLRERLGDELLDCQLHTMLVALDGPPAKPGTYRVTNTAPTSTVPKWTYTALAEGGSAL